MEGDRTRMGQTFFTFQYVSINTQKGEDVTISSLFFTFQYVSINTGVVLDSDCCTI